MEPILEKRIRNSSYVFWKPEYDYLIPPESNGHVFIPLQQKFFSAFYQNTFALHQDLVQRIPPQVFRTIIQCSNALISIPYSKLKFIRIFIFSMLLFSLIGLLAFFSIIDDSPAAAIVGIVVFLSLIVIYPFLMRHGCNQHPERMRKYEKVMTRDLEKLRHMLEGTGVIVEPGKRCMWLDFHIVGSVPRTEHVVYAQPIYFPPPVTQIII